MRTERSPGFSTRSMSRNMPTKFSRHLAKNRVGNITGLSIMREFLIVSLLLLLLGVAFACNKSSGTAGSTSNTTATSRSADDDAPRISLADAKKAFDDGSAVFIDTRPADVYKQEHVKGSLNITKDTLEARYSELPKDK